MNFTHEGAGRAVSIAKRPKASSKGPYLARLSAYRRRVSVEMQTQNTEKKS